MTTDIHIARYWDRIQGSKFDFNGLAERLHRVFQERRIRRVLDLGCGTGSLLLALGAMGYECVGLDIDSHMLAEARRKAQAAGQEVAFLDGDLRRLELEGTFDAVLCFQVLSLLKDSGEIEQALEGMMAVMEPEGILAFDVLGSRKARSAPPLFIDTAFRTEEGSVVRMNRMAAADRGLQWQAVYFFQEKGQVKMEIRDVLLKTYGRKEIGAMLRRHGLRALRMERHEAGGPGRQNLQFLAVRSSKYEK